VSRRNAALGRLARQGLLDAERPSPTVASAASLQALVGDPSKLTILDVMGHPRLFGPTFRGESFDGWRAFLAALFGLPMTDAQVATFSAFTGRSDVPIVPAREGWVIVGRRGGKSRIAGLVAVFLACFRDYTTSLAPGERGTVMVLAADRKQARTVMRYIAGLLDSVPALAAMVESRRNDAIDLVGGISIEVHTASYKSVRGYTLVGVVADEIAFWKSDEDAANPDTEVLNALRPAMGTIPGAVLLAITTPYARRGELWRVYESQWAKAGSPFLVWQADTRAMNPLVDEAYIAHAYAEDELAAAAEFGAQFRRDVEAFVSREALSAVIVPNRLELPPMASTRYVAFVDPSGGSQDSFTLAVAHMEGERAVLDLLKEVRPPFSPEQVVSDFAALLRPYRITRVRGDYYGGEWPTERFKANGLTYERETRAKSDLYKALLPLIMGGRAELLDSERLTRQLLGLERRTARGGRDSIDHGPGAHDDLANAAAGALVAAHGRAQQTVSVYTVHL
jgi:hypothetical protein